MRLEYVFSSLTRVYLNDYLYDIIMILARIFEMFIWSILALQINVETLSAFIVFLMYVYYCALCKVYNIKLSVLC